MGSSETSSVLTEAGCRQRQSQLKEALAQTGYDAAILGDRAAIHRLTGHWTRDIFQSLLLIRTAGQSLLATPVECAETVTADQTVVFQASPYGTLEDDQSQLALKAIASHITGLKRIGTDSAAQGLVAGSDNIDPLLRRAKRSKLPDEIAVISQGIKGCEAAYTLAKTIIRPGLTEISLYAQLLAAATEAVGEPIGEFGNDFQAGTPGGPPRGRAMQSGELIPLDLGVVVRGYHSDLCRTFIVGPDITPLQHEAHEKVAAALHFVEQTVRPGVSCRELYHQVAQMLHSPRGWSFPHHLGHGIGLCAHESPRLNPAHDDIFEEGDVFTAEPGLYAPELAAGIRIEQDYVVSRDGLVRLSQYPIQL
jgi:Xaa-Pro aminopeptidase